ncbi:hypothetical protein K502DRAFT_316712 [Neoconidiobolus thromboides FSU 785]|nr:hypothetical protein K502DRAFT_316712 [Neoconidiobolus thromboides FSU 785]
MDKISLIKYTDIDYEVFTDAARFVTQGKSPYLRSTYRYTPLLAFLLTPNIYLFKSFGKVLFVIGDLLSGYFMYEILKLRKVETKSNIKIVSLFWLYNPIVANISTRGNAESLLICIILAFVFAFLKNRFFLGSILYGLAVHFKIYPIIYSIPLLYFLNDHYPKQRNYLKRMGKRPTINPSQPNSESFVNNTIPNLSHFFTKTRFLFFIYSGATFLTLNLIFYFIYYDEFIEHTFLYHVTRKDHRHNFSFWFLPIYLSSQSNYIPTNMIALCSFLPQFLVTIYLGFLYSKDLFFAIFLQTISFVAFNKVCTSQYFMWYLGLLPLVLPSTRMPFFNQGIKITLLWVLSQVLWLLPAYYLEFEAKNTFVFLFFASIFMLSCNVYILVQFIRFHNYMPLFIQGQITSATLKEE